MHARYNLLVVLSIVFTGWAAAVDNADTTTVHRNFISFNPVSLIGGGLGANYERMFGCTGLMLEGEYTFPVLKSTGYNFIMACRFHSRESDVGGFFGPFIKIGNAQSTINTASKNEYHYRFSYVTAGLSIGKRGSLWAMHHWLYSARFGLGYPLKMGWSWNPPPPDEIDGVSIGFMKTMIGIPAYLDGELAFSFGF